MSAQITKYLPIYDTFFQNSGTTHVDSEKFNSTEEEIKASLSQRPVDFSLKTEIHIRTWKDAANDAATLCLKIALFPWGFYELGRYIIQRIVMMHLYPLQSRIVTFVANLITGSFSKSSLNLNRCIARNILSNNDGEYIVRDVVFEKNGVLYNGFLIGHFSTIKNGKWVVQGTGNLEPIEHSATEFAEIYANMGYNVLLINGPAVGKNGGQSNPDSMGEVQELGITYLETAIKAKKIVIAGRSLGGAAINKAIIKHQFKPDTEYLVVRQVTFDRASHIAKEVVGAFLPKVLSDLVEKIVIWSDCEMDCIEASRKLQELHITEVIVQATHRVIKKGTLPKLEDFRSDGAIPAEASLGYGLIKENIVQNKVFICLSNIEHLDSRTIRAAQNEIMNL